MANAIINKKTGQSLRDAIIDLYLNVKVRSSEEVLVRATPKKIAAFNEKKYQEEKIKLEPVDPFIVLDYIKSSVEMIMTLKFDEDESKGSRHESLINSVLSGSEPPKDYEVMLQKLEAEARNHIRIEQQLKLHIESLQFKLEDVNNALNKEKERVKEVEEEFNKLKEDFTKKEQATEKLTLELSEANKKVTVLGSKLEAITKKYASLKAFPKEEEPEIPSEPSSQQKKPPIISKTLPTEHRKSVDCNKIINANKGVGIHEQNIFQIICKSPDYFKDNNPYLIDLYKHRLEEKNREIHKLRYQLNAMQAEIKSTKKDPKYEKISYLSSTFGNAHQRSKSQSGKEIYGTFSNRNKGIEVLGKDKIEALYYKTLSNVAAEYVPSTGYSITSKNTPTLSAGTNKSEHLRYVLSKKSKKGEGEKKRAQSVSKNSAAGKRNSYLPNTTTTLGSEGKAFSKR